MPGSNCRFGLLTVIATEYDTMPLWVLGFRLTVLIVASNVRPGNASTVKVATMPDLIVLMNASGMLASIFIRVRSAAILNRLGLWKLAASVWPRSMSLEIITPSIG